MRTAFLTIALAATAAAQDKPKAAPSADPKPLPREVVLSLQNITLRQQLLQTQYAAIQQARAALIKEICEANKLAQDACQIDENAGTVTSTPAKTEPKK